MCALQRPQAGVLRWSGRSLLGMRNILSGDAGARTGFRECPCTLQSTVIVAVKPDVELSMPGPTGCTPSPISLGVPAEATLTASAGGRSNGTRVTITCGPPAQHGGATQLAASKATRPKRTI